MVIINVDRQNNTALGGMPSGHDQAVVLSATKKERNLLTGVEQPVVLFSGSLAEAHVWVRKNS